MSNRTNRTPEKDDEFFEVISSGKPLKAALAVTGYKRRTVYDWREQDEEFKARWEDAVTEAVELMEKEADRRAVKGVLKPVFYKGAKCGSVREFSDTLLIFRLKALAPNKYRERTELTGKDGGPVEVSWVELMKSAQTEPSEDDSQPGAE
ncbi:MAG: terminase [bacterium]|nr:terminase [bacterium]